MKKTNQTTLGDKVRINSKLIGEIVGISTGHGICFQVELPLRDFDNRRNRIVWLDEDEIEEFIHVTK